MNTSVLLLILLPVVLYYGIYFRHFIKSRFLTDQRPQYLKHLEAFLMGMIIAFVILLHGSYFNSFILKSSTLTQSFLFAALIEKALSVVGIYIMLSTFPSLNLIEAIISSILFALGFASVENYQYASAFGDSIIAVRIIFSVPMHITTCGIIGYYLALNRYHSAGFNKLKNFIKMAFLSVGLHGCFDFFLINKSVMLFTVPFFIIVSLFILEAMLGYSYAIPPLNDLISKNLRFEDWLSIRKHTRYEKWIYHSMGRPDRKKVTLFRWESDLVKPLLVLAFLMVASIGYANREVVSSFLGLPFTADEKIMAFFYFPLSVSAAAALIGIVNPEYFKTSLLRIPIIIDVIVSPYREDEETYIAYDISPLNCFLKTIEPLKAHAIFDIKFGHNKLQSPIMPAKIIWENHTDETMPIGTLVSPLVSNDKVYRFLFKYHFIRIVMGFRFLLKLPGFKKIKKFFIKPQTIMKNNIFVLKDTVIYKEGDHAREFYFVEKGEVGFYKILWDDISDKVATLGKGDIFGEADIINGNIRSMTAKAETDCNLAVADIADLKVLIASNPDFAYQMIITLSKQLKLLNTNFNDYIKVNKFIRK